MKRLWPVLKWAMFLLVLGFVVRHGYGLWQQFEGHPTHIRWGWLMLALLASVIAWLPSAWYWRNLLVSLGANPSWPQLLRAYYCGHLGKYVPGKAAALVIRSALLKDAGVAAPTAALTVTVETLTYMWAGTLLLIILYPSLGPYLGARRAALFDSPLVWLASILGVVCIGVGLLRMLMRSNRRLSVLFRTIEPHAADSSETASVWTCLAGACIFLVAWWLQGLTLGLTIQSVAAGTIDWHDWPFWTAAAAAALVGGFLALFAPGGLGVREGLLMEILKGHLGPHEAVVVAVLLRAVSLVGEILTAGALYYATTPSRHPAGQTGEVIVK